MAYSYVLFVDDDFWCHLESCEFLRNHGLNVVEAYTVAEACKEIERGAPLTALVTDVDLEDCIDGYDIARLARAAYPGLPVVFMSGTSKTRYLTEAVTRSEFISKPFRPQQIVDALGRMTCLEAA